MSLVGAELSQIWNVLRASGPQRQHRLDEVRVRSFRGINDLRVQFPYPVSVLAGANGCGKSTVLLACACAYGSDDATVPVWSPASVFPTFTDRLQGMLSDDTQGAEFAYYYVDGGQRTSMTWCRRRSWSRSFMGPEGAEQPKRAVYLHTLANLADPAEAQSHLRRIRKSYASEALTPDLLYFADRILPQRYGRVSRIQSGARDILFAELKEHDEVRYSEFHMASGERTILRLSKDISNLQEALILIDDVESGLHPYTQQQLMLELQRLALRQRSQVIVASHSPIVLDCVPPEGRLFLDRDPQTLDVRILPPQRDIFQKALYGQSREQISILCEDEVAEGALLGLLDVLQPRLQLRPDDFLIGRNTGRDEFPSHIRALGKFRRLFNFIFVLDGDSRDREEELRTVAEAYGHSFQPLFLPGDGPPEQWIWDVLKGRPEEFEMHLGMSAQDITEQMRDIERVMAGSLRKGDEAKLWVDALAHRLSRHAAELARIVAREESAQDSYAIRALAQGLQERIKLWRELE